MAFNSLNTSNLPDPGVDPNAAQEPRDYFETFLYTGNGTGLQVGDVIKKPADTTTISQSVIIEDGSYLDSGSISAATDAERRTWAWSGWVKFYDADSEAAYLLNQVDRDGSGPEISYTILEINTTGTVRLHDRQQSSNLQTWETSGKVNKDGMWHHILFHKDSTNQSNIKIWIDGVQQTLTLSGTFVTNFTSPLGSSTASGGAYNTMRYGRYRFAGTEYDRAGYYLAEVHFVQGSLPALSTFGEFDANGIWIPKAVTGLTYGTHGHKFTFADSSSFGDDTSGNTFDFTGTGFATTDQVTDSPTDNFCTWSKYTPLTTYTTTLSEGNLTASYYVPTNTARINGSIGVSSGKWYYEFQSSAGNPMIGWCETNGDNAYVYDGNAANKRNYAPFNGSATSSAYGATWTTTDVIGVALDLDNGTLTFYKNNTSQGIAYTGLSGTFTPTFGYQGGTTVTGAANFGQRGFTYTPPTGFVALSENNITVDDQNLESPDFVWIKNRDQADQHHLYDSVRGIQKALYSSATTAETAEPNGLVDFNKNGFTIGSEVEVNTANEDYVAWCWKANGATGVSNTNGSITSTVSANTTSGFSIVKYTGTGANATVGHGLSSTPEMVIIKGLDTAYDWVVWVDGFSTTQRLLLNTTGATSAGNWNTLPTSSVFGLGTHLNINNNGSNHIAYCFHSVDGFSKMGSYTGNGSANGPFVYTGFRPSFVIIKNANFAEIWPMFDDKRDADNQVENPVYANLSSAEGTASSRGLDFLSNGFKIRGTDTSVNRSGDTHIYMAFAENPFKYSNAR